MLKYDFRIHDGICRNMIGQKFIKFRCNEIDTHDTFTEIAGLYIGGKVYKLGNKTRKIDHFYSIDDTGIFVLSRSQDYAIYSGVLGAPLVDYPVGKEIKAIKLVNERQRTSENGEVTYEMWLTRAVIFCLDDEELLFEKMSFDLADDIILRRGQNLIETVASETEFLEGIVDPWPEGVTPECIRDIVEIQ